jgi:hypothetical protein
MAYAEVPMSMDDPVFELEANNESELGLIHESRKIAHEVPAHLYDVADELRKWPMNTTQYVKVDDKEMVLTARKANNGNRISSVGHMIKYKKIGQGIAIFVNHFDCVIETPEGKLYSEQHISKDVVRPGVKGTQKTELDVAPFTDDSWDRLAGACIALEALGKS